LIFPPRSTASRFLEFFAHLGWKALALIYFLLQLATFMYMQAGGGPNADHNHRRPPQWGPEMERTYSFRAYVTDLMHWIMLTDLQPHQQAAAILMRLTGSARELARTITGPEILNGGVYEGVAYDPVSYIIAGLRGRYGQLDEETRMAAMTELLGFVRHQNETINQVLARYELVRGRARNEGQFVMSVEGSAMQLMRACHVTPSQMMTLLQPFNHNLPATEAEFRQLQSTMRRIGHVLEHSPNNVGQSLGGNREARPGAYAIMQGAAEASPGMQTYFGSLGFQDDGTQWPNAQPAISNDGWTDLGSFAWDNWTQPQQPPQGQSTTASAFPAVEGGDEDASVSSGTGSDTSSDSGNEPIDMSDLQNLTDEQAHTQCFLQKRYFKRKWRRFTGKRVRKVRRVFKKSRYTYYRKGKGKGRSRSFGSHSGRGQGRYGGHVFLTQTDMLTYLKGKGKGGRAHTSGQSFGRKGNPKDKHGNVMKCHGCDSTEHLINKCPNPRPKGGGKGAPPPVFHSQAASSGAGFVPNDSVVPSLPAATAGYLTVEHSPGPLDELLEIVTPGTTQTFMVEENPGGPHDLAYHDPWAGAQFPVPPEPSLPPSGAESWNSYERVTTPDNYGMPAQASSQEQYPGPPPGGYWPADDPAMDDNDIDPRPDPTFGALPAQQAVQPAMQGFLTPAQLQDVLMRGRSALVRASGMRDARETYAEQAAAAGSTETGVVPTLQIFGRSNPPVEVDHYANTSASRPAPAAGHVPLMFGYNTPLAPSARNQPIPTLPATAQVLASAQPAVQYPAPLALDVRAPTTGSHSFQDSLSFMNQFNRAREQARRTPDSLLFGENNSGPAAGIAEAMNRLNVATGGTSVYSVPPETNGRVEQASARAIARATDANLNENLFMSEPEGDYLPGDSDSSGPPPLVDSSSDDDMISDSRLEGRGRSRPKAKPKPKARRSEITPTIYTGEDDACTLCLSDYEHGCNILRLQCCHTFHTECWERYITSSGPNRDRCPVCRGYAAIIAIWGFIDHTRVTQYINGSDGPQVLNRYDRDQPLSQQLNPPTGAAAEQHGMITPRSVRTDYDFQSPNVHPQAEGDEYSEVPEPDAEESASLPSAGPYISPFTGVILPNTFQDYNDWINLATGTALGGVRVQPPTPAPADQALAFHTATRLTDGRPAILIDPGSVGNLGGDKWVKSVAKLAIEHGRKPSQATRDRPLSVSGVGQGSQQCTHNCTLPVAFSRLDNSFGRGTFTLPTVPNSELPGLLGLQSMRERRTILDLNTLQMHLLGPGDYELLPHLPPGTESYQCEIAPSGHMVLPCGEYAGVDREERGSLDTGPDVALIAVDGSGQQIGHSSVAVEGVQAVQHPGERLPWRREVRPKAEPLPPPAPVPGGL